MALVLTVTPLPSIVTENAYHCIAGSSFNYQEGSATCVIQSYKDAATRDAYKIAASEMATLTAEYKALHDALTAAQLSNDQVAIQQARLGLMGKEVEMQNVHNSLEAVKPFGVREVREIDVSHILDSSDDVTRGDLYAAIKTIPEWSDAVDA